MDDLKPTQAAREAAAGAVYENMKGGFYPPVSEETRDRILNGQWDHHSTVQAFARIEQSAFAAGKRAGLMEVTPDRRLKTVVPAILRDKDAPTWELIVSLLRNSGRVRRDADLVKLERDRLRSAAQSMKEAMRAAGMDVWRWNV